jgi:hypothetical protein
METGVQAVGTEPALRRALLSLAEVASSLGATEVAHQVGEAIGRLQALVLEVAVVGEVKRGSPA